MGWHQKEIKEVFEELHSSPEGLCSEEAEKRLGQYGPNVLEEKEPKTLFRMLMDQFSDFMILVLIGAAVISGVVGELSDTIAIIVIVILNAVIGFIQEYRAEKAMAALKKMAASVAAVMRDGMAAAVPASLVVPGDMVILEAGKVVPADLRLTNSAQLKMDEAALTGESVAVEKHTRALPDEHLSLGDRKNLAFKGTFVTYGRGGGIAVATGMQTELGKIATMLQGEEEGKTPLQKRLTAFGRRLALGVLGICVMVFAIGVMRGEPLLLMMLTAISLAVAAIPEALPAVITISLALGAKKLVQQNALIRKLPAVETLGSVTYICSDKTGTLTLNKMTVEEIFVGEKIVAVRDSNYDQKTYHPLVMAMALNNDVEEGSDGVMLGDPTEVALLDLARKYGFTRRELESTYPRMAEIPFDSDRKLMTTFHAVPEGSPLGGMLGETGYFSFTKGAAEALIDKSETIVTPEGLNPIVPDEIDRIQEKMAADGLRVLGVAMRK